MAVIIVNSYAESEKEVSVILTVLGSKSSRKCAVAALGILGSIVFLNACRSKLEGKVVRGGKSAAVSISDGATVQRQFFQSGSVISLALNEKLIALGDSFTITNLTNNEVLVASSTIDPAVPTLDGDGFSYQVNGTGIDVRIFPKANAIKGKIVYGVNLLRVDVVSGTGDKFWEWEITMRDFPVFGATGSAFSDNVSAKGGFSGQFTGIVKPVVRADSGGVLRTGPFHMINH